MTFEEMYNDCFVELRDGKPFMAYVSRRWAENGIFWDRWADNDRNEKHEYEIKYLKDGKYYESEKEEL